MKYNEIPYYYEYINKLEFCDIINKELCDALSNNKTELILYSCHFNDDDDFDKVFYNIENYKDYFNNVLNSKGWKFDVNTNTEWKIKISLNKLN